MRRPDLRRGATVHDDGSAELVLWAPSFRDVAIERVSVQSEALRGGEPVVATLADDGEHWVARAPFDTDHVAYSYVVDARVVSTGRRFQSHVSDPYAREVQRDFRSFFRKEGKPHKFAPFRRPALRDLLIYELHVYNFTAEDPTVDGRARGTYEGVVAKLPYLVDLGFNAIELMPVFDYSDPWQVGIRWNYITACHLCAPHRGYAAREDDARREFIELVEACHEKNLAVIVDGVFNQVSRRFSYARVYDPDFKHHPKPDLKNNPLLGSFGGTDPNPGSFPYRNHDWGGCDLDYEKPAALDFVSDVMEVWFHELGIDGFRFDHTLGYYLWKDQTKGAGAVATAARLIGGGDSYRIAEHFSNDENERQMLADSEFNSEWAKGFFYAIEDALKGRGLESLEYRMDPKKQGFSDDKPPVVFTNSHDDERLVHRGGSPWWRLQPATIALYTHPGIPLVYMGDEYAEDDRTRYEWGLPAEISPLDWAQTDATGALWRLHRAMGFLRKRLPVLRSPDFVPLFRHEAERVLVYGRGAKAAPEVIVALSFSPEAQHVRVPVPGPDGPYFEFLFNLETFARGGRMHYRGHDGVDYDALLVPSSYAHIYCKTKAWTDAEWIELFAKDRDEAQRLS